MADMQLASDAGLTVAPLSDACGAEISGIDLSRPLSADQVAAIRAAWLDHLVILFRDQDLTAADQTRFCEAFGELEIVKTSISQDDDNPHILFVSNVRDEGKRTVLEDGEMYFHSDQCYYAEPVSATILYAMEVPSQGGDTLFANCYRAYDALDVALKEKLDGRLASNAYAYGPGMLTFQGRRPEDSIRYSHPIVRTHPETGRKALYLNRLMTEWIEGLDDAESDALLAELFDHIERPEFVYAHRWRPGDLLMWDNRCTLHARTDFDPAERRMLRRMTLKGDRPY